MSGAGSPRVIHVAAALLVRDGRLLVQERTDGGRWQGWWELPGGGLESGEDAPAAAVRECAEELDLAVRAVALLATRDWVRDDLTVRVGFVHCATPEAREPRPCLGQRLLWADALALESLRLLPGNRAALPELLPRLGVG